MVSMFKTFFSILRQFLRTFQQIIFREECKGKMSLIFKEGTFRVVALLKIHVWELACRCISIQQSVTRSGRMLSDEFLIDLYYVQLVQRGIRLDFPVVASCLRPVSTPVSATVILRTCYKLQNEHSMGLRKFYDFFPRKVLPPKMSKINFQFRR